MEQLWHKCHERLKAYVYAAGDSAGGNLSAVMTLIAKSKGITAIKSQVGYAQKLMLMTCASRMHTVAKLMRMPVHQKVIADIVLLKDRLPAPGAGLHGGRLG